jgi:glutamate synthase domain-containing protein 3
VPSDRGREKPAASSIPVPELRDYHQINAELVRHLARGRTRVRLEGVEGQRLLAWGLTGPWEAIVEVDGNAGPELAAEMDAPGITVVCRGMAADGAGRGLIAGTLVIRGTAGAATGYLQRGGLIVAAGATGPRPGLQQRGGDLVLIGPAGPLAGERRTGGRLFLDVRRAGRHFDHAARGGRSVDLGPGPRLVEGLDADDRPVVERALEIADSHAPPP